MRRHDLPALALLLLLFILAPASAFAEDLRLQGLRVVSATFTATADLDALFPASIARRLNGWDGVALLEMQQLAVRGDLGRCVRVLVPAWVPQGQPPQHVYQGDAALLRPDRASRP